MMMAKQHNVVDDNQQQKEATGNIVANCTLCLRAGGAGRKTKQGFGQGIAEGANIPDASVHLSGTHHLTENQHRRPVDQWRTYLATSRRDNRAMTTQTGEGTRVHFQKKRGVLTSWTLFVK